MGAINSMALTFYPEHGLAGDGFHLAADFDVANSHVLGPDLNVAAAAAAWVTGPLFH